MKRTDRTDVVIRWIAAVSLTGGLLAPCSLARAQAPPARLPELEAAVQARPADGRALVELARAYADGGRIAEGLKLLERAVALDSKDPAARAWLGSVQVRMARTTEDPGAQLQWVKTGTRTLDEAVEEFPTVPIVYLVRGVTGVQLPDRFRRYRLAIRDFTTLLEWHAKGTPAVPEAQLPLVYLSLGRAYRLNDQEAEARATWEKGRRLHPQAPEARLMDKALNGR
jgi:tetratricopeptide (TPR) repeat protein